MSLPRPPLTVLIAGPASRVGMCTGSHCSVSAWGCEGRIWGRGGTLGEWPQHWNKSLTKPCFSSWLVTSLTYGGVQKMLPECHFPDTLSQTGLCSLECSDDVVRCSPHALELLPRLEEAHTSGLALPQAGSGAVAQNECSSGTPSSWPP